MQWQPTVYLQYASKANPLAVAVNKLDGETRSFGALRFDLLKKLSTDVVIITSELKSGSLVLPESSACAMRDTGTGPCEAPTVRAAGVDAVRTTRMVRRMETS